MPGLMYHIAFAKLVYQKVSKCLKLDKTKFLEGNLIPDLATDKKLSHYRMPASKAGFVVPNMYMVRKDLFDLSNPVKLGMYTHLYLDYHFIEGFLIPEFIWDVENNLVINPRNKKTWTKESFFPNNKQDGLYGAYTETNQLLIRDGRVPTTIFDEIPEILTDTGIAVYDTRREKTWVKELKGYFAENRPYTGDIFNYDRLWSAIESMAEDVAKEIINAAKTA